MPIGKIDRDTVSAAVPVLYSASATVEKAGQGSEACRSHAGTQVLRSCAIVCIADFGGVITIEH